VTAAQQPATRSELFQHIAVAIIDGQVPVPAGLRTAQRGDWLAAWIDVESMAEVDAWAAWLDPMYGAVERASDTHEGTIQHRANGSVLGRHVYVLWVEELGIRPGGEPS
jgi:hypothetical protein